MSERSENYHQRGTIDRIIDQAVGSETVIKNMSNDELQSHLNDLGINVEKGWGDLQTILRISEGKERMAQARANRALANQKNPTGSAFEKSRSTLIEEIRGLIAALGGAVYARKWEDASLQDLQALRDELVSTAARAAKKNQDEQQL